MASSSSHKETCHVSTFRTGTPHGGFGAHTVVGESDRDALRLTPPPPATGQIQGEERQALPSHQRADIASRDREQIVYNYALPAKRFRSTWMAMIVHAAQSVYFLFLILGLVLRLE